MPQRRDDWIDEDEYPDDYDVEQFGDDSPPDYDPLTIGRVRGVRSRFWTPGRIVLLIVVVVLLASLLLPTLLPLAR